jgi:hypothetical protein
VEIWIKGVSVFARLSNNSRFTVVSASFVKNFNLKRLDRLTSQSFLDDFMGNTLENTSLTCLETFTFSIQGIEVTLRNALEISPDMEGIGIQLGQDFFQSAASCTVITEVKGSRNIHQFMRTDGHSSAVLPGSAHQESLQFCTSSDETASAQLLHGGCSECRLAGIGLKPGKVLKECNWCRRRFPKGMLCCTDCREEGFYVYYCTEQCHRAAWKVHQKTHHVWKRNSYR